MEKWEKLNIKIQLLNIVYEGERHYTILHENYTPILYMNNGSVNYPLASGIDNIDKHLSMAFTCYPSRCNNVINFLRKEVFE